MKNKEKNIPKVPWRDCIPSLSRFADNPADHYRELLLKYDGLMEVMFPYGPVIMTDRPDLIRHVTQRNHRNYIKSTFIREKVANVIGHGILTSNGEEWLKQRRSIQPGFHSKVLEDISSNLIKVIRDFMDTVMDGHAQSGRPFDMVKEMLDLTFRLITVSLFGESLDRTQLDKLYYAFAFGQELLVNRTRRPYLVPLYWLRGDMAKAKRMKQEAKSILSALIDKLADKEHDTPSILEMIISSQNESEDRMTEAELLDEVMVLYFAGHETTAISLSWTWFLLSQNTFAEEKIRTEFQAAIQDGDLCAQHLRELTYSQQVIDESLRMYPPAWLIDREIADDDEFDGHTLPKGKDMICLIYGLHNNPNYWNDPERFDPSRFDSSRKSERDPNCYIPFGSGPRMCIGKSLSLMEMQYTINLLLERYRFRLVEGQPMKKKILVVMQPKNGVMMTAERR